MNFFLKKYSHPIIDEGDKKIDKDSKETKAAQFWTGKNISLKDIAFSIAIAFMIVAVSNELSIFFARVVPTGNLFLNLINGLLGNKFLIITTISMFVATVFSDFFKKLNGYQEIGTFLIFIFFAVIGVPASIPLIIQKSPILLIFCGVVVVTNMAFTFLMGRIF